MAFHKNSFKNKIVLKEEANYFYDYELCEKKPKKEIIKGKPKKGIIYTMYSLCSLFAFIFSFFLN